MSEDTEPDMHVPGFKRGDVVRSSDGSVLGVVLAVAHYTDDPAAYELHVDVRGEGVGIWPPNEAVLANDAASVAEARRLGLRGLD